MVSDPYFSRAFLSGADTLTQFGFPEPTRRQPKVRAGRMKKVFPKQDTFDE